MGEGHELRHRHYRSMSGSGEEPLLLSSGGTISGEAAAAAASHQYAKDPLASAANPEHQQQQQQQQQQHRRDNTVTNIAEVYRLVLEGAAANLVEPIHSALGSGGGSHGDSGHDSSPNPCNNVIPGAVANLCSATLGAGVLALPYALLQAGLVVGGILLILSATATAVSIRVLVRSADHYGLSTYESMAEHVIGTSCRSAVEACMLIFCGGCAVAYMIAVGDILEQSGLLLAGSRTYSMILVFWMAMLPLSMLKRIQSLQAASTVGIAAIGTLVFAALIHYMTDSDAQQQYESTINNTSPTAMIENMVRTVRVNIDPNEPVRLRHFLWPANGLVSILTAAPVVLFAFSCQTNVCQIYEELPSRDSTEKQGLMRRVTIFAVCICAALYTSVSIIALADFGNGLKPNMLSCYRNAGQIMQVATAAMAFAVIMAFPLNIFPARVTLIGLVLKSRDRNLGVPQATTSATSEIHSLTAALLQNDEEAREVPEVDGEDHHLLPLQIAAGSELPPPSLPVASDNDEFDLRLHVVTTFFLTSMALGLALVLPDISVVFGLLGGTASSMLGFCVPGLLGLKLSKALREERGEKHPGMVIASWLLLCGGVAVGILTTLVTVYTTFLAAS